jgi:menaquinone-specific isochorismate synthase
MRQVRNEAVLGVDGDPVATPDARLVSRTVEVPDVSFRAFLATQASPRVLWAAPDGLEIAGGGAAVRLRADGPDRFDDLRTGAAAALADVDHQGPSATRPRFVGGLSYDPDHDRAAPWESFPGAEFMLPAVQLTRTEHDNATWLTVRSYGVDTDGRRVGRALAAERDALARLPAMRPSGGAPGVTGTRRTTTKAEWVRQVEAALGRIADGSLRKVVLATSLEADLDEPIDVADTLERLRRTYPDCYRFLVQPADGAAFFGPPPERLVRLDGSHVRTEALAGSVPRGADHDEDADLAAALLGSEKLQHEQRLVVDAIADQLEPLGSVREGAQGVRKLSNIQHLLTPIEADLDDDGHVLDIVEALHPTPAVGGLPLETALSTIRGTETFARGWYAAPVGWFDGDGDGEFAVAIRSAVAGGTRATLFAGSGIVADSDPDDEWDELGHKFRPVLDELLRE